MDSRPSDGSQRLSKGSALHSENQSYWTTERDGEVRLRLGRDANDQEAPLTVHDMVMHSAVKYVNYIALGTKRRNHWHLLTYGEYYELCRRAAKGFLKLGLERFHGVGILGLNSEEWVIANIGAIMAGGFSVGILSTATPKACQIIAKKAEINVLVVDTDKQLQKITQIQGSLKHLKAIVQYEDAIQTARPDLYSWQSFLDLGSDVSDEALDHIMDSQKPNQCCTLVYSVGATGPPKVIMLSHDNITWTTAVTAQSLCYKFPPGGQEVLVSYLPLSYVCAQIFDMWLAIAVGGALYFSPQEAKSLSQAPHPPGAVSTAPGPGSLRNGSRTPLAVRPPSLPVWASVSPSVRRNRCELSSWGTTQWPPQAGADLLFSLVEYPIIATRQDFRLLSSGKGLPNTRTKVKEEDEEGIGSISIWGRNIFMGYVIDNKGTMQKTDCYGWLHTGDLGFLDVDNFLYIRGNAKDIITLSSGKMINPSPIEERVKTYIPIVHYVMVVGQDAPYLCALLTLKCQVNWETGEPRTALTSETVALCRSLGSQATRLVDIVHNCDPIIADFISKGMEAVNAEATSDSARVVKWAVLDTDFSVSGGELGVTSRLKREAVARIYKAEIEHFYKDARSL
ncbi:long-chain-fatty-acid--CoA ligase ACSBG2-like [Fukomys damarensis]|uniref:long-chain-fatty-acid--CoA ligase ACSBG2-like n=1 Tax=Fukomys damarensis TaxID=885580 RepID=UPI00053FB4F7|nr:long-chain-fatty-acid--CoA ligase ACSBG2-like [Fukomys damarensis]